MTADDDLNQEALTMAYALIAAQEGNLLECIQIATTLRDTMDEIIEILHKLFDNDDDV